MTTSRIGMSRRQWLALAACAAIVPKMRAAPPSASGWRARCLTTSAPLQQIRAGESGTVLAVDVDGGLWSYATPSSRTKITDGIDRATPVAAGYGRIAARAGDGMLVVCTGGNRPSAVAVGLAPNAGLLNLPFAIVGVVVERKTFQVVRFEPMDGGWSASDRSHEPVMPDARPILAALEDATGDHDLGEVVVLAGPDDTRYQHGVLGDRSEATRILWLDRHSLRTKRELTLPDPFVFEDIAPRTVVTARGVALLTMRSGGTGTRLALVDVDRADAQRLRVAALGDAMSGPHRWLSPTTDGHHMLAIHTPHLAGVLTDYRLDGERLVPMTITGDIANHRIGTRELDLAVWRGTLLIVPSQDGRRLRVFDAARRWSEQASLELPARVVMTAALGGTSPDRLPFAVLLEDGTAHRFERSG